MVFRGYLDDHDLTAASFVGDWFRTGDLGRIDEDGYVYFVGRIKDIINRGGEKISPAEIDLAIESLPGVKEAAVFAIPHPSLGEEMVAAVVREENAAIDEAQVVERVRARAGVRKVPRRVYFVERLPRTDNGKLRRSALPELLSLEQVPAVPAPAGTGSLSPLEGAIAGLWSSLLKVDAVGRDDDFFLLGGDSLRGTQLIAHLRRSSASTCRFCRCLGRRPRSRVWLVRSRSPVQESAQSLGDPIGRPVKPRMRRYAHAWIGDLWSSRIRNCGCGFWRGSIRIAGPTT